MSSPSTTCPLVTVNFHVLRIVLGTLLLAAAEFKAYALWTDPAPPLSLFSSPRWQIALSEVETVLGLWLLSGLYLRGAWLAGVTAFSILAGVSLYLGVVGQPSCGCFGKLALNPWYVFGLDVAAVAALWYWRPKALSVRAPDDSPAWLLRPGLYLASGVILILAGCFAALWLASPSLSAALTFLRGESLTIEPSVVEVGSGVRGEVRDFSLEIRNHTDRSICLLGSKVGCHCITIEELPLSVPAGEVRSLACTFEFRGKVGEFQYPFVLYTDDESHSQVLGRVAGKLVEPSER